MFEEMRELTRSGPFLPTRPLRQQQVRRRSTLSSRHPVLRTFAVRSRRPVRGRSFRPAHLWRRIGMVYRSRWHRRWTVESMLWQAAWTDRSDRGNRCLLSDPHRMGAGVLILTCFCDAPPGYCMDGGANGYCTDSTNTVGSYCEQDWWDEFDLDCIGTNTAGNSLVYCSSSNSRCGGPGARCKADDGSASGPTSVCQAGS